MENVQLVNLKVHGDQRGSLVAIEKNKGIPFDIKRVYYIFGAKNGQKRGFHAHRKLSQLLIATSGQCSIRCIHKSREEIYVLNDPTKGLLIQGLVWREMFEFSKDCVLMVIASENYDESDYIRDFEEFELENQK